jgi:hypothetical protein
MAVIYLRRPNTVFSSQGTSLLPGQSMLNFVSGKIELSMSSFPSQEEENVTAVLSNII